MNPAGGLQIGYVLKMFPRLSETFILNEILELERQGVSLHIFSLKRPVDAVSHPQVKSVRSPITYLPEELHHEPIRVLQGQMVVLLQHRREYWHTLRHLIRGSRRGAFRSSLLRFCQACCLIREMGDIRHLHAHYANIPAKVALIAHRIAGVAYSITTHAKDVFQGNQLTSPKLHERMRRARFVVANSRFSAACLRAAVNEELAVHPIYNGIDLNAFPRRNTEPVEPLILSVGRLVEKKGFADFIEACRLLKEKGLNFRCEIVGTGRLAGAVKEQIRNCGVQQHIRMVGPLPQQELRALLERAMIFALACIEAPDGDRDILPNVLKEAMAVGVAVVTTHLDGIEELVEHGRTGLLVAPGDPNGLAASIELLLGDRQLRESLAARARTVIEQRFDRRSNFAQLRELLLGTAPAEPSKAGQTMEMKNLREPATEVNR